MRKDRRDRQDNRFHTSGHHTSSPPPPLWGHPDPRFNDAGYGPNPFRAESGPSHLPTAEEMEGKHGLWLEAVTRPST